MKIAHADGRTLDDVTEAEFNRLYGPAGFVEVEEDADLLTKVGEHDPDEHAEPQAHAVSADEKTDAKPAAKKPA